MLVFVTHCFYSSDDYERLKPNCIQHLHIEDVTRPIEYLALVDMHEMNQRAALLHHYHSGSRLSKPLALRRPHSLGKEPKTFPSKQLSEQLQGAFAFPKRNCPDLFRALQVSRVVLKGPKKRATV
jgi:hypothetical protein